MSHSKHFFFLSHLTSTWSYTLYAHLQAKRTVFQLFRPSEEVKAGSAECVQVSPDTTYSTTKLTAWVGDAPLLFWEGVYSVLGYRKSVVRQSARQVVPTRVHSKGSVRTVCRRVQRSLLVSGLCFLFCTSRGQASADSLSCSTGSLSSAQWKNKTICTKWSIGMRLMWIQFREQHILICGSLNEVAATLSIFFCTCVFKKWHLCTETTPVEVVHSTLCSDKLLYM